MLLRIYTPDSLQFARTEYRHLWEQQSRALATLQLVATAVQNTSKQALGLFESLRSVLQAAAHTSLV
jgi:hypothetical protein